MFAYLKLTRFATLTSKAKYLLTHGTDSWEIEAQDKAEAGSIVRKILDEKAGLVNEYDFDVYYSNRIEFLWGSSEENVLQGSNDSVEYKYSA